MAVTWRKLAYETDVITKATIVAKGDILVGTAAATPGVLSIGTDGYLLKVATDTPGWVDPATLAVPAHEASHKNAGSDEILLNEFGEPTAAVAFDGQQAQNLVLHTVANAGARPTAVVGKGIFQTDELAVYVCTVSV